MKSHIRQPFQVAVFQFRIVRQKHIEYALLKRADANYWQPIAGGGEGEESSSDAALRESFEEAGIVDGRLLKLTTSSYVPAHYFKNSDSWPKDTVVIPHYYFAIECAEEPRLSTEHTEYVWADYHEAHNLLKWDDNKTALWEIQTMFERFPERFGINLQSFNKDM